MAHDSLLAKVDKIIQDSIEQKNPDIASDAISYLLGMSRLSGLTLAKMIYTFKFQWSAFNRREKFESYLSEKVGISKVTIKRYYQVWDMLVSGDVPREYAEKLKLLPVRCLVPIGTLWTQGWEVTDEQWSRLANATDPSTVNKIIREIKKVEPKSGSLQIVIDHDGMLYAWQDNVRYDVGHLNVDDFTEAVQKAIARILGDGIVMEQE
jgi:hemin uptake protein HemP